VRTDETFELVSPATARYFACMLGAFQVPFLGMLAIVLLSLAGHRTTVGQALLGDSARAAHSFHRSPGLYGAGTVVYFLGSIVGWIMLAAVWGKALVVTDDGIGLRQRTKVRWHLTWQELSRWETRYENEVLSEVRLFDESGKRRSVGLSYLSDVRKHALVALLYQHAPGKGED
jgi:hypothetical protein